ncbi:16915_t:CDS:1, partial [Racocetra persica]
MTCRIRCEICAPSPRLKQLDANHALSLRLKQLDRKPCTKPQCEISPSNLKREGRFRLTQLSMTVQNRAIFQFYLVWIN